jgi:hypothetical protein
MNERDNGGDEDTGPETGIDVNLNFNDRDPSAGASDVGGRAGDDEDDLRGEDQHEVGGGQTGMGKGPTGS